MDIPTDGRIAPDPRPRNQHALLAYGLWLRLALVGILLVTGGAASLADGEPNALAALGASLGGAVLAAFAWRRAAAALARMDVPAPDAPAAAAVAGRARRAPAPTRQNPETLAVPQA